MMLNILLLFFTLLTGCNTSTTSGGDATATAQDDANQEAQPSSGNATARNSLILVTLDTTRADRIGAYGYEKAITPNIDRMAEHGVRFERAYATVPLTTPSHASMLTGLYPTRHGIHTNGDAILADEFTTLAERLSEEGYRTAASISAFVTHRVWNLNQGFDQYFDEFAAQGGLGNRWSKERPAEQVITDAIGWLKNPAEGKEDDPFFLWVHLYDPHHPHMAPDRWIERFPDDYYNAELAYVDEQIGRLRAAASQARGDKGVGWIIIADHGEAFEEEHGETSHGLFLFDPTMRVPFIVRPPSPLQKGIVVDDRVVSGVDVTATALGMLQAKPIEDIDGVDLSPLIRGGKSDRDGAYMESYTVTTRFGYHPELGYAQGQLKLIDTPTAALYDVVADPTESNNIIADHEEKVSEMRKELQVIVAEQVMAQTDAPAPEVYEQLAALGYISGGLTMDPESPEIDAKDRLQTISLIEKTRTMATDPDKRAEAEQIYRQIIKDEPQLSEAQMGLARVLAALGKTEEAIQVYQSALEKNPESTVLRTNLATALAASGNHAEGLKEMEKVLEQVPSDDIAQIGAIRMLTDLRQDKEALNRSLEWLKEDPGNTALQAHVGIIYAKFGDFERATPYLESSLVDGVPRQFVHRMIARSYTARSMVVEATEHFRKELEFFPFHRETRHDLGRTYLAMEKWDDAAAEYQFLCEMNAEDVRARNAWAQAVFNTGDYDLAKTILSPALTADPPDAHVVMLQANIVDKLGDRAAAQVLFEQAKELRANEVAQEAEEL